jgi:hypothetical protein
MQVSMPPEGYGIPVPGAWARRAIPAWCETRYEAAQRLEISPRWLRELLKRHEVQVYYVRRHVRIAPGVVRIRYAVAIPPSAVEELASAARRGYRAGCADVQVQSGKPGALSSAPPEGRAVVSERRLSPPPRAGPPWTGLQALSWPRRAGPCRPRSASTLPTWTPPPRPSVGSS